jgi:hypothetical protein
MIRMLPARARTQMKTLRLAGLMIAALGASNLASAQNSNTTAASTQRQIDELAQSLKAMQAQLLELLEQNRALLRRQQELEQQLAKSAQPAAPAVVAGQAAQNPVPPGSAFTPPGGNAPSSLALPASSNPTPPPPPGPALASSSPLGDLRLWGYGEIYYTRPTHVPKDSQADLARAVFGIGYVFDDRTEFNSEFEIEHAVSSASDPGEFEVEQFYIDRKLIDAVTLRAGLFLMPFGLLNEHHEPTNFYGVQRNFVETLIIPSTWREGGFNLHGDTSFGLEWNAGLTTGFDLSKWNFAPEFPLYTTALQLEDSDSAPLQASHQELALANAEHLSQYVALGYYGIPGLTLGAAISTGDAVKVPAPPNAPIPGNQRVTLWETHARWTPGPFDLSALYAHGSISNTEIANASNPGSPNPIPSRFYGYFAQGAYTAWTHDDYRFAPFVRWERYNLGSKYEGTPGPVLPSGFVPLSGNPGDYGYWPINQDRVWTLGANFYTSPHLVFKADYQWFHYNSDFSRFDLGLGLAF